MSEIPPPNGEQRFVPLDDLYLDPNNYRVRDDEEYVEVASEQAKDPTVVKRTRFLVSGEDNKHIKELIHILRANGYLPLDLIQVRPLDEGGYLVVDGNRRVAALKWLALGHEERGLTLGRLAPALFARVPVQLFEPEDELQRLLFLVLKHTSRPQPWSQLRLASLLATLTEKFGLSESEILERTEMSKQELWQLLRAHGLSQQYLASEYGDQFDEGKFSLFLEITKNQELREWLNWSDQTFEALDAGSLTILFSLVSEVLEEDADGATVQPPITNKRDLKDLIQTTQSPQLLEELTTQRSTGFLHPPPFQHDDCS